MSTTVMATLALAVGLALAACGDADFEPLTKAEFVAEADAICAASQDETEPVFEAIWTGLEDVEFDDPANEDLIFERWATAMDELVPIVSQQLDEISDLTPPGEDEEFIATLIVDQRTAMEEFDELVDQAAAGSPEARLELEDEDPFVEIDRRARSYGLVVCGSEDG